MKVDAHSVNVFRDTIYSFYKKNKRTLPWRETIDPYHILISEVMLQQTQVDRVIKKYHEFTQVFPTVEHLAQASFADVYRVWAGLGYNRRARYLIESAGIIVRTYKGSVPAAIDELQKLPGIGYNTACAILAFAFNKPVVFIETNIRSVFIHCHPELDSGSSFNEMPKRVRHDRQFYDKDLLPLIEQTLDKKNPREWYWALMDYGSYLKKTTSNPSRKSAHFTKQSKFEGSDRQLRGRILRLLSEKKFFSTDSLLDFFPKDSDRIMHVLKKLQKDGLITLGKSVRLAE